MSDSRELLEQAKRVADAAEKLLREAERLRRDVRSLGARIVPLEVDEPSYVSFTDKPPKSFRDMFKMLNEARKGLEGAERDILTIRSAMDVIANDVIGREEMKKWLIEPPHRKDRDQG